MLPFVDLPPEAPALTPVVQWAAPENSWPVPDLVGMYLPPDLESGQPPVLIIAAAEQVRERVIGVCAPSESIMAFNFGNPAQHYLMSYEGKDPMEVDISKVEIKLLEILLQPEHGRILMNESNPYHGGMYIPDEGYIGRDRMEAVVSVGGDVVRVVYNIAVQSDPVDQLSSSDREALCPKGFYWQISGESPSVVSSAVERPFATSLNTWLGGLNRGQSPMTVIR